MRAPWKTAALVLGLCLPASGAHAEGSDLDVSFGWDRWSQMRANPRRPAGAVRQTRVFPLVLRPKQSFFAPHRAQVTYFPRAQRWEYRDPFEHGPSVIRNVPRDRTLWLRWDLWRLPREAQVERAELRLRMRKSDLAIARRDPPTVTVALQEVTPRRIDLRWNDKVSPPPAQVQHNYPGMWWDVTRFVHVAHQVGDLDRSVGLVIDNAGRLVERDPELHVWFRIPVPATAE